MEIRTYSHCVVFKTALVPRTNSESLKLKFKTGYGPVHTRTSFAVCLHLFDNFVILFTIRDALLRADLAFDLVCSACL